MIFHFQTDVLWLRRYSYPTAIPVFGKIFFFKKKKSSMTKDSLKDKTSYVVFGKSFSAWLKRQQIKEHSDTL